MATDATNFGNPSISTSNKGNASPRGRRNAKPVKADAGPAVGTDSPSKRRPARTALASQISHSVAGGGAITYFKIPLALIPAEGGMEGNNPRQMSNLDLQIAQLDRILMLNTRWRVAASYFKVTCDAYILRIEPIDGDADAEPFSHEDFAVLVDSLEARAKVIRLQRLPEQDTDPREIARLQAIACRCGFPQGQMDATIQQLAKGDHLRALLPHGPDARLDPLCLPPTEELRPNTEEVDTIEYRDVIKNAMPNGRLLELANNMLVVVPPGQDFSIFRPGDTVRFCAEEPRRLTRWLLEPKEPIDILASDLFASKQSVDA